MIKNAKDRLKNSMITRVKKDYLSLTQHTYLLSIEAKSHEDWFKNQANYIFGQSYLLIFKVTK